jgi:hypothetical protein
VSRIVGKYLAKIDRVSQKLGVVGNRVDNHVNDLRFPLPKNSNSPIPSRKDIINILVGTSSCREARKAVGEEAERIWQRLRYKRQCLRVSQVNEKHRSGSPSHVQVKELAATEGWGDIGNLQKDVSRRWVPLPTRAESACVATAGIKLTDRYHTNEPLMDEIFGFCVSQMWPNLQIRENVDMKNGTTGRGVVIIAAACKGDVLLDYHASHRVSREEAKAMMEEKDESVRRSDYLFCSPQGLFLDAYEEFCNCHQGWFHTFCSV